VGWSKKHDKAQKENVQKDTTEVTISYRTRNHLIIVPAIINDTIKVNLILEPHCHSLILFGKRFEKQLVKSRGTQRSVNEKATRYYSNNSIKIGPAVSDNIPVVVMPNNSALNFFTSVDGIIGYDLIAGCDIKIDRKNQTMTLKPVDKSKVDVSALNNISLPQVFWGTVPAQIEKLYSAPMIYRTIR
jgi:hypothetical protein